MQESMAGTPQLKPSRIFVRNLPVAKFSEKDLRDHFSKFAQVTDCRYFPKRHIAFVGYRTSDDAETAAKYFDKTYIRTSKLGVELAKSINEGSRRPSKLDSSLSGIKKPFASSTDAHHAPNAATKGLKRKRDDVEDVNKNSKNVESDPRLKEYLALSQHSSKLKTWENDLQMNVDLEPQQVFNTNHNTSDPMEEGSDDEYVQIPSKKPIVSQDNAVSKEPISLPSRVDDDLPEDSADIDDRMNEDTNGASDADWLRSRQNRTLDLDMGDVDDETLAITSTPAQRLQSPKIARSETREQGTSTATIDDVEDAENQAEEEVKQPDSERTKAAEEIMNTGRLFVRNLYYSCTENDLRGLFEQFGKLEEVHVPIDSKTNQPKGMAFILFSNASDAVNAYEFLDGEIFQGRSIHILPGKPKRAEKLDDFELSKLPLKKQREIMKRRQAAKSEFEWNSLYMNIDSVIASTAKSLGVSKAEVLDPTSSDAVVRQAQAETQVIQDTKAYFEAQGVDLTAFSKQQRGDNILLIKNFPFGTTSEELQKLLSESGEVRRVLMPPSGTIAIVEMANDPSGRAALSSLYGRKFKDSVLKLEKGPKDLFIKPPTLNGSGTPAIKEPKASGQDFLQTSTEEFPDTTSLYIKNLNFSTTWNELRDIFEPLNGFVSAHVQTKPDPKNPRSTLSQGYGFAEFKTKEDADAAQKAMNGFVLQGYKLNIQPARRDDEAAQKKEQKSKNTQGKTKIIIKNLAFEVTEKQVKTLFSKYGKLRSLRLPKKFNRSTRGFGFADFITAGDATNAMEALKHTHLHGRPLVLEWAKEDSKTAEEEIERLTKKASKQVNSIQMAKLTSSASRKKSDIRKLVEGDDADLEM